MRKVVRKEPKSKDVYIKLLVKVHRQGQWTSVLFGVGLVFTAFTVPTAVQVSFEADRLQVQQSCVKEVVYEQNQQAPHFHSASGEFEHIAYGLCMGVGVIDTPNDGSAVRCLRVHDCS